MDAFFNNVFVSSGVWTCEARCELGVFRAFEWESEKEGGGREEDNQTKPTKPTSPVGIDHAATHTLGGTPELPQADGERLVVLRWGALWRVLRPRRPQLRVDQGTCRPGDHHCE